MEPIAATPWLAAATTLLLTACDGPGLSRADLPDDCSIPASLIGKKLLGWTLLLLGGLVLTGLDKYLEAMAVQMVPDWVFSL